MGVDVAAYAVELARTTASNTQLERRLVIEQQYGEALADESGARLCHNPESLASALEKLHMANQQAPMMVNPATENMFIVNPLTGGGMMSLFSTHPPIEERIARLRAMRYS